MSITSHDPCGGGGISADIETLASLGCHCTPIITQLCARDTSQLKDSFVTHTSLLIEQIRAVLEDINVNLFSIGDVTSIRNAEAIHTILCDYSDIPVLLHPGKLKQPDDCGLDQALSTLLLPRSKLLILSKENALALAPSADTLAACAQQILDSGCNNLLITGDQTVSTQIKNHWFLAHSSSQQYTWERLPYAYQGANDTLAAATSAYLAHGLSMAEAIQQAQQFTWQALHQGRRIGMGKLLPDRMHWCKK